jgi:hypothetical protein
MTMDPRRAGLYSAGAVLSFNLIFFILSSEFLFRARVHHHWVLPLEALFLGLQVAFFARSPASQKAGSWAAIARNTSFSLLLLTCLIGTLRIETIFSCAEGCHLKLGFTYLLAGGAACFGWGFQHPLKPWDRFRFALGVLLLSAGTAVISGIFK